MKINKHYQVKTERTMLFNAWISESMLIPPIVKIEVEPRVSGSFILHAQADDEILLMKGEFLEIVPYEKLIYTWNWQGNPEITTVAVSFIEIPSGTEVLLTHEGFETQESKQLHEQGWETYMKELSKKLEA